MLADYDYFLRLDDDSILETAPPRNFFEVMEERDYWFGYRAVARRESHPATNATLPQFVDDYLKSGCFERPPGFSLVASSYYSNFELSALEFWKRNDVWTFLKAIDANGGIIYEYRWGDSPIHGYCVRLFCPPERIWGFDDFVYLHASHDHRFEIGEQVMEELRRRG